MRAEFKTTGFVLANMRRERKITQAKLAKMIGSNTAQTISNFERGISMPPKKALPRLIKALKPSSQQRNFLKEALMADAALMILKEYDGLFNQ